jgi:spore germination protein KA
MGQPEQGTHTPLTENLHSNINSLKSIFSYPTNKSFVMRELFIPSIHRDGAVIYLDGTTDIQAVENHMIEPLLQTNALEAGQTECSEEDEASVLITHVLTSLRVTKETTLEAVAERMVNGYAILLIEGSLDALSSESTGFEGRPVSVAEIEQSVKGPKEAFAESLAMNRSLIRKSIRAPQLVCEEMTVGQISKQTISVMYMKNIADPELVGKVKERIKQIESDAIQNISILEQHIEERPYSLFPSVLITERPDRACSFLLEGHIVLLMDNSPNSLIAPATFWSLFHTGEDQYLRWPEGNFIRILRVIAIFIALFTPSIYLAVSNFHVEMLPTDLMLAIAATRERVPFSSILEVIFMEVTFEILRESAVRVPSVVGLSIGIVGTLILGTAAVDANLVSPILVVIVAITGLSSFAIPGISLNFAVRLLRFVMLFSAVIIGFYGIALLLAFLLAYLVSLKSFGIPFLSPMAPHQPSSKDLILRPPLWKQWLRPFSASPLDEIRSKKPKGNE